jgi:hypothetical protein
LVNIRPQLGLVLALEVLTGCGSSAHVVKLTEAEQTLSNLARAYHDAHEKLGHGPKDAQELKPFLKEYGDPDQLLVSSSDGQPFVVVWGVNPGRGGPTPYQGMWQILAYEQKGKNGVRAVTDVRGRPMTVPAEDFSKLTFAGGHKPSN